MWKKVAMLIARCMHNALSFVVFFILDGLDFLLCNMYKVTDFFLDPEREPCYCSSEKDLVSANGQILVSERGESKIVFLSPTKLELREISDTLFNRASFFRKQQKSAIHMLKGIQVDSTAIQSTGDKSYRHPPVDRKFRINIPRFTPMKDDSGPPQRKWSDCDCKTCTEWINTDRETLFVRIDGAKGRVKEDVLFIHGFISSSLFWTETIFPCFSKVTRSNYRLLAVDLLGFGRSPKPADSFYTLKDHIDMIENSVIRPYKLKSYHIVAHSLGCILALALSVKHPNSVKSLTLLAPPCYRVPKGSSPTQFVLRKIAPKRLWPSISLCSSVVCWYEHITRTLCLFVSKNHRFLEFVFRVITFNRMKTYMFDVFFCHTHVSAWHTLHNIICGAAGKVDGFLETVSDKLKCGVTVIHGEDDKLIPVECAYNIKEMVPRANVVVLANTDHLTIVVGRQYDIARRLESIWRSNI